MPLRGKYKMDASQTEKALNKIFKKSVAKKKPKAKKVAAKKVAAKKPSYAINKKDPAIGSKERESDLESLVSKGKTGLPKRKKRSSPKRYYAS